MLRCKSECLVSVSPSPWQHLANAQTTSSPTSCFVFKRKQKQTHPVSKPWKPKKERSQILPRMLVWSTIRSSTNNGYNKAHSIIKDTLSRSVNFCHWSWKMDDGIEFFNVFLPSPSLPPHQMFHYRSTNLTDIDMHLLSKWKECLDNEIPLPAVCIWTYTPAGSFHSIHTENTTEDFFDSQSPGDLESQNIHPRKQPQTTQKPSCPNVTGLQPEPTTHPTGIVITTVACQPVLPTQFITMLTLLLTQISLNPLHWMPMPLTLHSKATRPSLLQSSYQITMKWNPLIN